MKTSNEKLLNKDENRKYYSKSDGNWIDERVCTKAHQVLPRVAFTRKWVHELGSKYHLDVGTKDGYTCLTLASEGVDCIGIDPSVDAIEEAQSRNDRLKLDATFKVSFLEDFPMSFTFDSVSMMEVLEHVINPEEVLQRLAGLATFVIITTPDIEGRHGLEDSKQNEEHVRLYSKDELKELCSKYGEVLECEVIDEQLCIVFKSNGF